MLKNLIIYPILGAVYLITYFFKINKNRVTFISYKADKLQGNFKVISDCLEKEEVYDLCYILTNYSSSFLGNIKYLINCIKQVYFINTSKLVILDYNNYVVSKFKKSDVKVLQVWHASGAIKKFGNDIKRPYKIKNYDYILCTSDEWKKPYSTAFNVKEENVIVTGIPRNDYIFSKKRMNRYKKEMLVEYPQIGEKKVVLFAPTFRGDSIFDIKYQGIDLDHLKEQLGDDYILIYRVHPAFGDIKITDNESIINGNKDVLRKLFSITDYLITDYSAVLFDFAILNKPIIFFTPDLEEYTNDRGMYIDYSGTLPGPICKTEDEVIDKIICGDFSGYDVEGFRNKYFKYTDTKSSERVMDLIIKVLKE